ncbi:MAG: ArsA-related P-loop ATPase [Kineosporiaceae bacterium]
MRLLLFTGTGGSGTTTVAAAVALHAARGGVRTALLTVESAEALLDVLDLPDHGTAATADLLDPVDGRLPVRVLGGLPEITALLGAAHTGGLLDQLGLDPMPPDVAGRMPGLDELAALTALARALDDELSEHDLVVVDLGPIERALRLLAAADAVATGARYMVSVGRRVDRAMTLPADPLVAAVDRTVALLGALAERWEQPTTSVRVVTGPGRLAGRRVRRALPRLAVHGLRVEAVVVNRSDGVRPDAALAGVPEHHLPEVTSPPGPVGPDALAAFGALAQPDLAAIVAPLPGPEPVAVGRDGNRFELTVQLPSATRESLAAARLGDDLVVRLGGHARVITLSSALRRCRVVGARLVDDVPGRQALTVDFEPDPALWRG